MTQIQPVAVSQKETPKGGYAEAKRQDWLNQHQHCWLMCTDNFHTTLHFFLLLCICLFISCPPASQARHLRSLQRGVGTSLAHGVYSVEDVCMRVDVQKQCWNYTPPDASALPTSEPKDAALWQWVCSKCEKIAEEGVCLQMHTVGTAAQQLWELNHSYSLQHWMCHISSLGITPPSTTAPLASPIYSSAFFFFFF